MSAENSHPNDQTHIAEEIDAVEEELTLDTDADTTATPADIDDTSAEEEEVPLTVQLERAESKAEEYLDSLQRERAAFQNYKRRVERERTEQTQVAAGNVLAKVLPILDDFYRAIDAVPQDERNDWFEGVTLIQRKLERFLADEGVTEIEALGAPFDPNLHEAIGIDPEADDDDGIITAVLQRGYMHGDRVLRPAMVRVAG